LGDGETQQYKTNSIGWKERERKKLKRKGARREKNQLAPKCPKKIPDNSRRCTSGGNRVTGLIDHVGTVRGKHRTNEKIGDRRTTPMPG